MSQVKAAPEAQGGQARLFAQTRSVGPDGRSGWRWVELLSKEAIDREALALNDATGSYGKKIGDSLRTVFSLRDPDNRPHLILETLRGGMLGFKLNAGSSPEKSRINAYEPPSCPPEFFGFVGELAPVFSAACDDRGWGKAATSAEVEAAGVVAIDDLGLCVKGQRPSEGSLERFKAALSKRSGSDTANQALPKLALLGWMELLELALPLSDKSHRQHALSRAAFGGPMEAVERLLREVEPEVGGPFDPIKKATQARRWDVVDRLLRASNPEREARFEPLSPAALQKLRADSMASSSEASSSAAAAGLSEIVQLLLPTVELREKYARTIEQDRAQRGSDNAKALRFGEAERVDAPVELSAASKLAARRAMGAPSNIKRAPLFDAERAGRKI